MIVTGSGSSSTVSDSSVSMYVLRGVGSITKFCSSPGRIRSMCSQRLRSHVAPHSPRRVMERAAVSWAWERSDSKVSLRISGSDVRRGRGAVSGVWNSSQ